MRARSCIFYRLLTIARRRFAISLGAVTTHPPEAFRLSVIQELKQFIMKGNLVTLAIAFIIGAVFADLVKAFIADLITPIIALIIGKPDFSGMHLYINFRHFMLDDFIHLIMH